MPGENELAEEDYADPITETAGMTLLHMVAVALLGLLVIFGLVAYGSLAHETGLPYLKGILRVNEGFIQLWLLASPLCGWLGVGAILTRRLPWWVHFNERPYARYRNMICALIGVLFAVAAAMTTVQGLWTL